MPEFDLPEPFGIDGARDALSSGGGAAVPPPPASARFAVTLHLLDGTSVPAGSDTHDGIGNMRAMIDARGGTGEEIKVDGVTVDVRRTVIIGADTDRGWIVPADKIASVSWKPE